MKWWGWIGLGPLSTIVFGGMWATVHYHHDLDMRQQFLWSGFLLICWMLWWSAWQK